MRIMDFDNVVIVQSVKFYFVGIFFLLKWNLKFYKQI